MKQYVGTKIIYAEPAHKEGADGYFVKYPDGYTSWSPKEVFEEAYRESDALTFGLALEVVKMGCKVARRNWNGKGMWVGLHKEEGSFVREACGTKLTYRDYLVMKTVDDQLVPWVASQTDLLAEDWVILE